MCEDDRRRSFLVGFQFGMGSIAGPWFNTYLWGPPAAAVRLGQNPVRLIRLEAKLTLYCTVGDSMLVPVMMDIVFTAPPDSIASWYASKLQGDGEHM